MRLIDIDELPLSKLFHMGGTRVNIKYAFVKAIMNAPVVDAVKPIHCKDCKNWSSHFINSRNGYCRINNHSDGTPRIMDCNDYCSYAEKFYDEEDSV